MDAPLFRGNVRLGAGIGAHLRQRIRKAQRSIHVLSPYLSNSFIADLLAAQKRGVQVHLLTSDSESLLQSLQQRDLYRSVLQQRITRDEGRTLRKALGIGASVLAAVGSLAATYIVSPLFLVATALSALFLALLLRWRVTAAHYEPLLDTFAVFCSEEGVLPASSRSEKRLVHAKVYIIDGKIAYLGSLNFTYRGFHGNYESLIEVSDEAAVRKIADELASLPKNTAYAQADMTALGDFLYRAK